MFDDRKYCYKVPKGLITAGVLHLFIQTSLETLRENKQGTKVVIKYKGDDPPLLNPYPKYTASEMVAILDADPDWNYSWL